MHLKTINIIIFIIITTLSCSKSSNPIHNEKGIRIGVVVPLSGSEASAGHSIQRGVELKAQELNSAGGIFGNKIEIITLDDRGKPEEAAIATTKLITQKGVRAIIGTLTSTGTFAMAPIAEKYKVPLIAPTATHPKITEAGENIFRVCFVEALQGKVMARFALETLHMRHVAILYDSKSDYSLGLKSSFSKTLREGGGVIVIEQSFSSGDIDFKSQLTSIRTKNPDAIFIPAYYTEVGLIAKQARELGLQVPLLGGDGWDSPRLLEIAGHSMNNAYFSNHYSKEDRSPLIQSFLRSFQNKFQEIPDAPAALGYDSMGVLANALLKSPEKLQLRNHLAATHGYSGVTGLITMDQQRNADKSVVILGIQKNQIQYQTKIEH
jgi:branched-chain amino acid transport system substrate-binding protein